MARVRVHQHVNPLARYFRELPAKPLVLKELFANPELPLHLDIGAGRGRFLLQMAQTKKDWNFIGMEIRELLVKEATRIKDDLKFTNLHYEFCNVTVSLNVLLQKLPRDILRMVTIQFPDPWFKKKHAKRRMVTNDLVDTLEKSLAPNGKIFIQTDVEFLASEMLEIFKKKNTFSQIDVKENPFAVITEREKSVKGRSLEIYRSMFKK